MRKKICIVLLMLFCFISMSFAEDNLVVDKESQVVPIKEALIRWICYQNYWLGTDYKLGATLSLEIKVDRERFFVWVNDLPAKNGRYHFAVFYTGRVKDGKEAVINSQGYNKKLPPTPYDLENRRHFETGTVIKDSMTMTTDCTSKYDSISPQKELMLQTIIITIQKKLKSYVNMGLAKYPEELTLIIADFNVDYPRTYVLIDPVEELYSVTLHDPQNYNSDEYEREGEYPSGEEYNKSDELLTKVRKHGIIRKITLDP